eukprot:146520-Chlamydomonas_euryale.AAC.4
MGVVDATNDGSNTQRTAYSTYVLYARTDLPCNPDRSMIAPGQVPLHGERRRSEGGSSLYAGERSLARSSVTLCPGDACPKW